VFSGKPIPPKKKWSTFRMASERDDSRVLGCRFADAFSECCPLWKLVREENRWNRRGWTENDRQKKNDVRELSEFCLEVDRSSIIVYSLQLDYHTNEAHDSNNFKVRHVKIGMTLKMSKRCLYMNIWRVRFMCVSARVASRDREIVHVHDKL
jgi:hypothetical protein